MPIVLSHPSVANFVQQVARSLFEAGQLERFFTTVRDQPESLRQRALCAFGRLCRRDLAALFHRRAVTEIPLSKVEAYPWRELARLAAGLFDGSGRLTDIVWERTEVGFDRLIARRLPPGITAVYGYEFASLATFQAARARGVRTIYDLPAPETHFVQSLLDHEMAAFPELRTAYHAHIAAREERRAARRRAEWDAADLIFVNSQFTKQSYVRAGLDCSRVRVLNLGSPPPLSRAEALAGTVAHEPLSLIWAGTFSIRKGAHYLLKAWQVGRLGRYARLRIFGAIALPERLLRPMPEGIEIHGSIPRSELLTRFRQADALIFPTLCDGFGLVATEAWSRGVPVITTDRAGAADLLQPNTNGLLIRAGDSDAIVEIIEWCQTHRRELNAMREGALATAMAWQWHDYRRVHGQHLKTAGMFGSAGAALASR